jgi:nucleotide-binding universal stress UspA family protein
LTPPADVDKIAPDRRRLAKEVLFMFTRILIASDGSDNALRAAETVAELAKGWQAEVTVVCVAYVPAMYQSDLGPELTDTFVEDWQRALEATKRVFEKEGVEVQAKLVREGKPAHVICREAEAGGYDLVVVGSKGLDESGHKGLGSVSDRVVHGVHCSVLAVK